MTARFATTLGALAFGLAALANPVFAQGGAGGQGGGGNVPSGTPTTTNAGEGHPGPAGNATQNGNPATTGTLGQGPTRHARRHMAMHTGARRSHMQETDTPEGDAAIERLNSQSLQAAQQGQAYAPRGAQQQ